MLLWLLGVPIPIIIISFADFPSLIRLWAAILGMRTFGDVC
jgi:hypothetical protein